MLDLEIPELERKILKTVPYPERWSDNMLHYFIQNIPAVGPVDPKNPEWRETPVVLLDLSKYGFGEVLIKDESSRESNPTGTHKDRAAWELAKIYRFLAQSFIRQREKRLISAQQLESLTVPRFTLITAGNEGVAVACCFQKYGLPPPKLVMDLSTGEDLLQKMLQLQTDIYLTDLDLELTPTDINSLTDNEQGIDLTSCHAIDPQTKFYDQHVHEAFNLEPDFIFVPYGSGRLMENYLSWQSKTLENAALDTPDPRLKTDPDKVIRISVIGATSNKKGTRTKRLYSAFHPFTIFQDFDIRNKVKLNHTGPLTGIQSIDPIDGMPDYLALAEYIYEQNGINAEPSAASSLALYLANYRKGIIKPGQKVLIINTGKGI